MEINQTKVQTEDLFFMMQYNFICVMYVLKYINEYILEIEI